MWAEQEDKRCLSSDDYGATLPILDHSLRYLCERKMNFMVFKPLVFSLSVKAAKLAF